MLKSLRKSGNNGTVIDPHRSIATVQLTSIDIVLAVALALGATVALAAALPFVGRAWTSAYGLLAAPLGFTEGVGTLSIDASPFASFVVPYFRVAAESPGNAMWWGTLVVAAIILAASFALRDNFLPLAYGLRLAVFVQATALVAFRIAPQRFPYDLPHYVTSMLTSGIAVMLVVPTVLGMTFYVVDVGIARKIELTVVMLGHLFVFIPLQYALQTYVIAHGSLLLMPLSFMLFGLLPEVMVLIALYGWGMSWPAQRPRGRRE